MSAPRVVALALMALALSGCHPPRGRSTTTVDLGAAGGVARAAHLDRSLVAPAEPGRFSHADYAFGGGTAGARFVGPTGVGGFARLASTGGALTYAEEIYRQYGLVFDRYRATSVTAGLAADGRIAELSIGASIQVGATEGDRRRVRGAFGLPVARLYFHLPRGFDLGLAGGSEDGCLLDPTIAAVGARYRTDALRLGADLGFGSRVLPSLDGDPDAPAPFPRPWRGGVSALAVVEAHAALGPGAELGARLTLVGVRAQGMLVLTLRRARQRPGEAGDP